MSATGNRIAAERNILLLNPANHYFDESDGVRRESTSAEKETRDVAFSSLVDRHSRLLYRIAFSLLHNAQDAEDTVQEVFLKIYRTGAWQRMQDEKAFLARTVWRLALDRLPKLEQQEPDQRHDQLAGDGDSPETNVIREAHAAKLRTLIAGLPVSLRRVLVLCAIEEFSSREVGVLLGIPEGTVRTRLMHAREELRRRFEASERNQK